jgi:hypothetical protein
MEDLGSNNEINSALQEFGAIPVETGVPPAPAAAEIDESMGSTFSTANYTPRSGIVEKIIKYSGGLIKNESQAHYVLLAFVIMAFIISFFMFYTKGGTAITVHEEVDPDQLLINGAVR